MQHRVLFLAFLCLAFASGCTSSNSAGGNKNAAANKKYTHVLVVGVAERAEVRKLFEDSLVRQLADIGTRATASYQVTPNEATVTREQVIDAVKSSGANSVAVTRLVKRDMVQQANTPDFSTFLSDATQSVYRTPPAQSDEMVVLETRVFDAASQQPVWTHRSGAFDPRFIEQEVRRLTLGLVTEMKNRGLI